MQRARSKDAIPDNHLKPLFFAQERNDALLCNGQKTPYKTWRATMILTFPSQKLLGSIFLKSSDTCYALYGCGCHSASACNKSSVQFMRGRFAEERQNTFITSNKSVLSSKTSNLQAASVWQIWLQFECSLVIPFKSLLIFLHKLELIVYHFKTLKCWLLKK